jgi:hypothetical protein
MLEDLRSAHQQVLHALDQLAAVIGHTTPDSQPLAAARLSLSQASRNRRALLQCSILPALHDLPPAERCAVADLRRTIMADLVTSSDHIARWTPTRILADWAGYRRASDEMRAEMRRRIEHEAALLYPLLERRAAPSAARSRS